MPVLTRESRMLKPAKSTTPSFWTRLLRNRSGAIGLLLVSFFVIIAIMGALGITPYPPLEQHVRDRLKPPSAQYAFGTDLFGRDVASRLMTGAANSLRVAVLSVTIATAVGTLLGTASGYLGGHVDNI